MKWLCFLVCLTTGGAWGLLLLTSHGILYEAVVHEPAKPNDQATLTCSYFTGLGAASRQYWYSPNGMMGRDVCPRLIDFR